MSSRLIVFCQLTRKPDRSSDHGRGRTARTETQDPADQILRLLACRAPTERPRRGGLPTAATAVVAISLLREGMGIRGALRLPGKCRPVVAH